MEHTVELTEREVALVSQALAVARAKDRALLVTTENGGLKRLMATKIAEYDALIEKVCEA
jgi:hypothetical protein